MKKQLLILTLSCFLNPATSQEIPPKTMILNSIMSCKPDDYSTFMAVQRGYEAIAARQYPKALKNFEQAKEKDPNCCDAWYSAAYIDNYQGNFDKALANSTKSVELNTSNPSGYTVLGYSYLNLQLYDSAKSAFSKVIKQAPELIDGYYGLAYSNYRTDNFDDAISNIELGISKASNLTPFERKKLQILNGKAFYLLNRLQEAEQLLMDHKGRLLDDGEACFFVGELFSKSGNSKKASQFKAKAVELGYNSIE